jgi:hypothetical protein
VRLRCNAPYSRVMAARQFGSLRAARAEEGMGEMAVELELSAYRGLGL